MSLYKSFETNEDVEQEGILVDYGDARFLLARAGGSNVKFRKVFNRLSTPYRKQISTNSLSEDVARKMLADAYAQAVILRVDIPEVDEKGEPKVDKSGEKKWKLNRVPLPDGTDSPASTERVIKLLMDLPELFADIQEMAQTAANYRGIEEEEDAGN